MWHDELVAFFEYMTSLTGGFVTYARFANMLTLLCYIVILIIALKGGVEKWTILASYIIISALLEAIGISSDLNVISLIVSAVRDAVGLSIVRIGGLS